MAKQELLIIAHYPDENAITLAELCEICGMQMELIREYVTHDVVKPKGKTQEEWVFDVIQLRRLKTALRLQHDLEVNLAGVALVLDLLEELESSRAHSALLEKHFSKL